MAKNKRRIEVATGAPGVSSNFIDIAFEHGTAVNIHGFRAMTSIEPEVGDANANGLFAVYVLPGGIIQNSDLPTTFGTFGDEDTAPYLWGIIPWTASNQSTANIEFAPKTSRTLERGGRIVVLLRIEGVSAGGVRHNTVITCFTSNV